jgi:multidrug efflux system outer membrane protein
MTTPSRNSRWLLLALPMWLAGCAITPPATQTAPTLPAQWQSPRPVLPHSGQVNQLAAWWRQWNDPLLTEFIEAAQQASPTLATARTRIAQARTGRVAAGAINQPRVDASGSAVRGELEPGSPAVTTAQVGLQASWEIDLFGAGQSAREAAQARAAAADAGWHEARVSVAADTAAAYLGLRACEQQRAVSVKDAASRAETARLVQLSAEAGFTAPAVAALARASASESSARLRQQQALCESQLQALATLVGWPAERLRTRLGTSSEPAPKDPIAGLADTSFFTVAPIPADVLSQRPDLFQAERAIEAARADVGSAQADRYPRLALAGSIAAGQARSGSGSIYAQTWSIGPFALTVPVFDAGRRAANIDLAKARYDEAVSQYQARVRSAVQEVEQALTALDSARGRSADARAAAAGYRASFDATETRHRNGLASLVELEDARRNLLAAETALVSLQRELYDAWVGLYRAAGGGWQRPTAAAATSASTPPSAPAPANSAPPRS